GPALTNSAIGAGATLTDPAAILSRLNSLGPQFDIDGNGQTDALTDGLLMIRYLFGRRGADRRGHRGQCDAHDGAADRNLHPVTDAAVKGAGHALARSMKIPARHF